MKPNTDNYYSKEIQSEFITNSQIKDFFGSPAKPGCQAAAMAKIKGEYKPAITDAFRIGKYVEAYFENRLDKYKEKNPDLFKKDGSLYAKYEHANKIIETGETDILFMKYLEGEKQLTLTGEIFGVKFLGRLDVSQKSAVVDLKCIKDFEAVWCGHYGKLNFIDAWGYADQMAIYQELERQRTGLKKECFIAALTKEKTPDKAIFYLPATRLEAAMLDIESKVDEIVKIKSGKKKPLRCETCDYCKSTKILTEVTHYNDVL